MGGEPQPKLNQVGQALVALALEMVLGRPQRVVAKLVHHTGDIARGPEYLAQPLVRIAAIVCARAFEADIIELDLAYIECVEPFDHFASNLLF